MCKPTLWTCGQVRFSSLAAMEGVALNEECEFLTIFKWHHDFSSRLRCDRGFWSFTTNMDADRLRSQVVVRWYQMGCASASQPEPFTSFPLHTDRLHAWYQNLSNLIGQFYPDNKCNQNTSSPNIVSLAYRFSRYLFIQRFSLWKDKAANCLGPQGCHVRGGGTGLLWESHFWLLTCLEHE